MFNVGFVELTSHLWDPPYMYEDYWETFYPAHKVCESPKSYTYCTPGAVGVFAQMHYYVLVRENYVTSLSLV